VIHYHPIPSYTRLSTGPRGNQPLTPPIPSSPPCVLLFVLGLHITNTVKRIALTLSDHSAQTESSSSPTHFTLHSSNEKHFRTDHHVVRSSFFRLAFRLFLAQSRQGFCRRLCSLISTSYTVVFRSLLRPRRDCCPLRTICKPTSETFCRLASNL
jgi:hypothetical protein